jgi:hypothetical protein
LNCMLCQDARCHKRVSWTASFHEDIQLLTNASELCFHEELYIECQDTYHRVEEHWWRVSAIHYRGQVGGRLRLLCTFVD